MKVRNLIVILGDQLDANSAVFNDQSPESDLVWMAEVPHEIKKVWSHKARIVLFLASMRHFAQQLKDDGWSVDYQTLKTHRNENFSAALDSALKKHQPKSVYMIAAGEEDVSKSIEAACAKRDTTLHILEDSHFLTTQAEFSEWKKNRKRWLMEHFYHYARRKTGYLMKDDKPVGGQWNLDSENRKHFATKGPGLLNQPIEFPPDDITRTVIKLVAEDFSGHPGDLNEFNWPVNREQALLALDDFISNRLPVFGPYQDAMWTGEPWLYHSRLSTALNLKLINPAEVIERAIAAYDSGQAPLNSVEGFVRQILGWREYVRHLYYEMMPELISWNALDADQPLPDFYWTGETDMQCLQQSLGQTLKYGYAHHIQRLMVTGLFALLLGVKPRQVHEWYLAIYVDAVEWVEAPNTLCMSQYADDGKLASKPYVASGRYIQRMSNYCDHCRYDPGKSHGAEACPFTTLYWDFLQRHQKRFAKHPRTALQWRNLDRLSANEKKKIQVAAERLKTQLRN